jgi:hypothetical protein
MPTPSNCKEAFPRQIGTRSIAPHGKIDSLTQKDFCLEDDKEQ